MCILLGIKLTVGTFCGIRDGSVDHNMLRHIGGAQRRSPSPELGARGGAHGGPDSSSVATGSSGGASVFYKKSSLSQKQRNNLRAAMIGFLENTRSEESALVSSTMACRLFPSTEVMHHANLIQEEEFEAACKEGEPFPQEEFLKLNDMHHKNYDILMQYLSDYQPQAFGKSYSQDPDYKELQRQFADVDKTNGSAARSEAKPKLKVLKTKKKTKKIR